MGNERKKGWKGYVLEFIMLFLAVSLGFMADNYREKATEKTKGEEYIQSMIEDVKEDRGNIAEVTKINSQRAQYLDSLISGCFNYSGSGSDKIKLNQYFAQVLVHPEFLTPAELTMQQLKNAGGMRLIKSNEAINEIIRYDTKLKKIANQQLYYENYQNKAIGLGTQIFNIQKLVAALSKPSKNVAPEEFELISDDNLKIKELGNSAAMYKGIIEYYVRLLQETEEQGEALVRTLEREYELK